MADNPNYCATCYDAAEKAGRPVKQTDVCDYPICGLCEGRIRNGLTHYIPSNGFEGRMFQSRCEQCAHSRNDGGLLTCTRKILDQLCESGWSEPDSLLSWYDPEDMDTSTCPATCLRFTHKDDGDRELREPPPPDCIGQMTLGELLTVPERAVGNVEVTR